MTVNDCKCGALQCTLFYSELCLLVQALNEFTHNNPDVEQRIRNMTLADGLSSTMEIAALFCALVNDSPVNQDAIDRIYHSTLKDMGFKRD
ncbi:MAG: hypothetical protein WC959_05565 [Kiritimatiellales bacterium]